MPRWEEEVTNECSHEPGSDSHTVTAPACAAGTIPRIFPIPSGPGPKLFRSCAIAQVSYFHSFSSSFHSFSFLLSWFPFLFSNLGLRWAQMVVQGVAVVAAGCDLWPHIFYLN